MSISSCLVRLSLLFLPLLSPFICNHVYHLRSPRPYPVSKYSPPSYIPLKLSFYWKDKFSSLCKSNTNMCFNPNRQAMPFNNGQLTTQANWLIHKRHTMARHTMAFNKRSTDHTSQLAYPHQAHYGLQQKVNWPHT